MVDDVRCGVEAEQERSGCADEAQRHGAEGKIVGVTGYLHELPNNGEVEERGSQDEGSHSHP
ncbi:hypothetical protein GCM10012285_41710 [Streptomyces kronopolitis]|uniref:Uncharacterized protein n=1 Tax=Streptomyces kronopolitis TaxID=1612435 RepID=A0ABQ2JQE8_9ACTN|nr:hypothetical protein GCM10012285_41710 [Streptomyces kronopolitis]